MGLKEAVALLFIVFLFVSAIGLSLHHIAGMTIEDTTIAMIFTWVFFYGIIAKVAENRM